MQILYDDNAHIKRETLSVLNKIKRARKLPLQATAIYWPIIASRASNIEV